METVSVYADGSSDGTSKGAIGWGWILVKGEEVLSWGCAGDHIGTNNIAELQGAIYGLRVVVQEHLHERHIIELVSDSRYCLGLADGSYQPSSNHDLVKELRSLAVDTNARFRWVRGHSGSYFNEKCDKLAKIGKERYIPPSILEKRKKKKFVKKSRKLEKEANKEKTKKYKEQNNAQLQTDQDRDPS